MGLELGWFGDGRLQKGGPFLPERLLTVGQQGIRIRPL